LAYDALLEIEKLAQEIYESLPDKALIEFISSDFPRTKLTTDLLANTLIELAADGKKDISVAYFWEPAEVAVKKDSLTSELGKDMMHLIEKIRERDHKDDVMINEYFAEGGNKAIPLEDELTMKAVNEDLANENSYFRNRADLFKGQIKELMKAHQDTEKPVYFFGVTHHSALIALDVAYNGRKRYDSVDEIPKPLSLWEADLQKE